MSSILIVGFLVFLFCPLYLVDGNWCIEEVTTNLKVTKVLTRIRTSRRWYGGIRKKTVAYTVTELVPRTRNERVCCEGFILNKEHRICEPHCKEGCPEFAHCYSPNICLCKPGYMNSTGLCVDSSTILHFKTTSNLSTTTSLDSVEVHLPETTRSPLSTTLYHNHISTTTSRPSTTSSIPEQQSLTTEEPEISTIASFNVDPTKCDNETCSGGTICINGLCQCPEELDFCEISKTCINNTCELICQNGTCEENGECKCFQGFVLQEDGSCLPKCNKECINGECVAPGKCECLEGFGFKPENIFECVPIGNLSGELKTNNDNDDDDTDFSWIWAIMTVTMIAILGFALIKFSRKHSYSVDKTEKRRHLVKFESNAEQLSD